MRFSSAHIRNYKRFTNLTIRGVPETARLIMLAGPNGTGKSSFFDALNSWHKNVTRGNSWDNDYHMKIRARTTPAWSMDHLQVSFHDSLPIDEKERKKVVYVRSAYRNDPEFQTTNIGRITNPLDDTRINRMIDNDVAVSRNYQRLVAQVFDIFDIEPMMTDDFTESLIGSIRDSVQRLFPNLMLNSLANPLDDGTFRFTKGSSEGFPFKNLSGGEKAAFDLILDLVIARRVYNNTLFCIDEPESHINARIQGELLSLLYELIPENCQLLLATHSIGMMRRARDIEVANPGCVSFLDFGERDFDEEQLVEPSSPDRAFWGKVYDVALDDVAALVGPERIVICEGEPRTKMTGDGHAHDARCYQRIFEGEYPETQFVPGGNATEVAEDKRGIAYAVALLVGGAEVVRVVDRDARSNEEVEDLRRSGVRVLSRRNLESFLFDDEILRVLALSVGKEEKTAELLREKEEILNRRVGDAPDDLKPASGEIYVACRRVLQLPNPGETAKTFMRDTLADLISAETSVYSSLRDDIFGS